VREQATLVAFYGEKRDPLGALIDELHEALGELLGSAFTRYAREQVHATLVGLESTETDRRINLNLSKSSPTGESPPPMDLAGYLRQLREATDLPFRVQFGGFRDRPYSFTSRSLRPFLRSFSLRGPFAVLVGWPWSDGAPPPTLDRIRRAAGVHHIQHQYHRAADDFDNDLYMRLGSVDRECIGESRARWVEDSIREWLAGQPPVSLSVGPKDLSVVSYADPTLPWGSCRQIPLQDIDLESELLAQLHPPDSSDHENADV